MQHIANAIKLPLVSLLIVTSVKVKMKVSVHLQEEVERKLSRMILDKTLNGKLCALVNVYTYSITYIMCTQNLAITHLYTC